MNGISLAGQSADVMARTIVGDCGICF